MGRCGGSGKWIVSIVLLMCEILVNGTPSSAVTGSRTKCYKEVKAAEVYWEAVPEANYPPGIRTETFDQKLWYKDKVEAWRKHHGEVDYGI